MFLSEIFDHLKHGEFSQTILGDNSDDVLLEEDYPKIVSHINLGLLELYKRFPIRTKEIQIQLYSSITEYKLREDFAQNSGSLEPVKYLLDSATDLFKGLVLKVERVETSNVDVIGDLPLNDPNEDDSVYTPYVDILKVPAPNDVDILTLHYRTHPDRILTTGLNPDTEEVELPYQLLEALLFYVASRATANRPSIEGQDRESVMYLQKFEASVAKVKELGLSDHRDKEPSNQRFEDNGWV